VTSNPKACVNLGAMAVNKDILPKYDFASVDATTNKIVPLGLSGLTVDTTVTPNQLCGNIPVGQEVVPILRINAWSSSTSNVDNTCQANKNAMAAIIAQQVSSGRLPAGASYTPPTGAKTQVAFNAAANSAASFAAAAAVTQANTAAVATSSAAISQVVVPTTTTSTSTTTTTTTTTSTTATDPTLAGGLGKSASSCLTPSWATWIASVILFLNRF